MYRRIFGIILGVLSVSRHKSRNVLRISQKNQSFFIDRTQKSPSEGGGEAVGYVVFEKTVE